jgi:hypothetical protein
MANIGLNATTGTARARLIQNRLLNIAVLCPACCPEEWTWWSPSIAEWWPGRCSPGMPPEWPAEWLAA